MQRAGPDFFAGTGFAGDEDGAANFSSALHMAQCG